MTDFEQFLKDNNLKKIDLADYLHVSKAFITQLCQGRRRLPAENFALLKAKGWDTAALLEFDTPAGNSIRGNENTSVNGGNVTTVGNIGGATNSPVTVNGGGAELSRMLDELREQNRSQREQIQSLTEIIKNLTSR